jgi:hypothetical protein
MKTALAIMIETTLRRVLLPVAVVGIFGSAMGLVPSIGRTAFAEAPTWALVDYEQESCINISSPYSDRTAYYAIWVDGAWTRSLNAGLRNVPVDSTTWGSYLPIPRGSSDGIYSLASVAVQIPTDTAVGTYTLNLWVGAGKQRQTVPVTLVVLADSCSDY